MKIVCGKKERWGKNRVLQKQREILISEFSLLSSYTLYSSINFTFFFRFEDNFPQYTIELYFEL